MSDTAVEGLQIALVGLVLIVLALLLVLAEARRRGR